MINRRIVTSLMILGIVGALAGGSTWALLSDTETSDTNTFQAGPVEVDVETPPGQPLAQMDDVKPGDVAEEEVSVETEGNPAFVEMRLNQTEEDTENSCTEPEAEAEGGDCGEEGELRENTHLDVWYDSNDNGEMDEDEEVILSNPHEDPEQLHEGIMIDADPSTEEIEPLQNEEMTIMYRWEVPRDVGNEAQTDSFSYNLQVRAEQARHNSPENAAEWYQVTGEDAGETVGDDEQESNETENNETPNDNQTDDQENESADETSSSDTSGFSDDEESDSNDFGAESEETSEENQSEDEAQSSNAQQQDREEQDDSEETTDDTSEENNSSTGQATAGVTGLAGVLLVLFIGASALYRRRL